MGQAKVTERRLYRPGLSWGLQLAEISSLSLGLTLVDYNMIWYDSARLQRY